MTSNVDRPKLPPGWEYTDAEYAAGLLVELQRELPPGHPLYGVRLEAVAACCDDDTLFRHIDEAGLFTVVHLTLTGKQEIEGHPTVPFQGSFAEFLAREWRRSFELNPELTLATLRGENVAVLDPEIRAAFPTDEAVNDALRSLIRT